MHAMLQFNFAANRLPNQGDIGENGSGDRHGASDGSGCHIIIASESPRERMAWRDLITGKAFVSSEFGNGAELLKVISSGRVDLVIASVVMPQLDGFELLRAVREFEKPPPIVLISPGSGDIDRTYVECAMLLGAAAAFMQPLIPADFNAEICSIIESNWEKRSGG